MPQVAKLAAGKELAELVDWAECKVMEGGIEPTDTLTVMQALGKLGVADVKQFSLLWEDCKVPSCARWGMR